jgi:hypothetical protein
MVDNKFDVYVVLAKTGDTAKRVAHFDKSKIWKTSVLDILIRFRDIDAENE